ncbi:MAG: glycoside hydrolase family 31 protein [Clostridia bacterium]|nr:glycoside hydrolase family 31 protein [Clostridia bacterium]
MSYTVTPIKKGMIRISKYETMSESYLERYGIISIPEKEEVKGVEISDGAITLPDGKRLEFTVRPETDDEFWADEINYQLEYFKEKIPSRNIEGRPGDEPFPDVEAIEARASTKKFGISFKINDDEKFYGLGEAGRDRIQHRGGSYQNWAVYQFDEVVIPLIYSNKNWGVFIAAQDRHFVDVDDHAKGKLTILGNLDELDVFVLYGDTMKDIIRLYTDISGKSMLLPKWAYGLTYIAQIHQNQFEILDDMMKFRQKHIPCDNVSLEPGWMTRFYDYSFEKEWDLKKFHIEAWMRKRSCRDSFLGVMRSFGFHVALWFCMNYDLCDLEESYITGERKIPAWYDHVKKFIDSGVDGMKIDPADMLMRIDPNKIYTNGKSELEMHNISQVLVMKQMHQGFAEQMNMRPYLHYSGGYTGQQKWGAATTGDNGGGVGSMIWLENLSMSGFMNSTVDMSVFSIPTIHFAMLAPWAHHNAWSGVRQPWYAGPENEEAYTFYARLRYSILPYMYSAAIECHETGVPMMRPMPLEFQNDESCSDLSLQYMLGAYILISAFTDTVYLPAGRWLDYWTNEEYMGPCTINSYIPPKGRGGAFFIKMGAIIPKWRDRDYVGQYSDEEIELHIYPCGKTEYIFREDDGESLDYIENNSCHTLIRCDETGGSVNIRIGKREGGYKNKTKNKTWLVKVHGTGKRAEVVCDEETAAVKMM